MVERAMVLLKANLFAILFVGEVHLCLGQRTFKITLIRTKAIFQRSATQVKYPWCQPGADTKDF